MSQCRPQITPHHPHLRSRATPSSQADHPPPEKEISRHDHNTTQKDYFTEQVKALRAAITPTVDAQLARVAEAVPGLGPTSSVLDVGAGEGALLPHLHARGVEDILAVDVCAAMLEALHHRVHGDNAPPSTLGNHPCVRTWLGDVVDLPQFYGPFDAAFFNAVFANLHDQRESLLRTALLIRPGGWVIISHPLGRVWLEQYARAHPEIVPHTLPTRDALEHLISDLPLELVSFRDDFSMYLARLKVPEGYSHGAAPLLLQGAVVRGFGRGSRQLGVPTANIDPGPLADVLESVPSGVYFGWARLAPAASSDHHQSSNTGGGDDDREDDNDKDDDSGVYKMVMNVGRRPTFSSGGGGDGGAAGSEGESAVSVEVHILHTYTEEEFYGRQLRVVVLGFLRPEIKFSGVASLLERIRTDIGIARCQLDTPSWRPFKDHSFLLSAFDD